MSQHLTACVVTMTASGIRKLVLSWTTVRTLTYDCFHVFPSSTRSQDVTKRRTSFVLLERIRFQVAETFRRDAYDRRATQKQSISFNYDDTSILTFQYPSVMNQTRFFI